MGDELKRIIKEMIEQPLTKDNLSENYEKIEGFLDNNIDNLLKDNLFYDFLSWCMTNEKSTITESLPIWRLILNGFSYNRSSSDQFKSIINEESTNDKNVELSTAKKNNDIIRKFFNKLSEADINHQDDKGNTALHDFIAKAKVEICEFLIEKGANINIENYGNKTPLAVLFNTYKPSSGRPNKTGQASIKERQEKILELLLNRGASVNTKFVQEKTALHIFVAQLNFEVSKLLIDKGIDVNAKDEAGNTALHSLLDQTYTEEKHQKQKKTLKLLLRYNAATNVENDKKETPIALLFSNNPKEDLLKIICVNDSEKQSHLIIESLLKIYNLNKNEEKKDKQKFMEGNKTSNLMQLMFIPLEKQFGILSVLSNQNKVKYIKEKDAIYGSKTDSKIINLKYKKIHSILTQIHDKAHLSPPVGNCATTNIAIAAYSFVYSHKAEGTKTKREQKTFLIRIDSNSDNSINTNSLGNSQIKLAYHTMSTNPHMEKSEEIDLFLKSLAYDMVHSAHHSESQLLHKLSEKRNIDLIIETIKKHLLGENKNLKIYSIILHLHSTRPPCNSCAKQLNGAQNMKNTASFFYQLKKAIDIDLSCAFPKNRPLSTFVTCSYNKCYENYTGKGEYEIEQPSTSDQKIDLRDQNTNQIMIFPKAKQEEYSCASFLLAQKENQIIFQPEEDTTPKETFYLMKNTESENDPYEYSFFFTKGDKVSPKPLNKIFNNTNSNKRSIFTKLEDTETEPSNKKLKIDQ